MTTEKKHVENVAIVSVLDLFSHMSRCGFKLHSSHFNPESLTDGTFIPKDEQWLSANVVYNKTEANLSIGCIIPGMADGRETVICKTLPVIRSGEYVNSNLKLALPTQLVGKLPMNTYERLPIENEEDGSGFVMVDVNIGALPLIAQCEKRVMLEEIVGTIAMFYREDFILKHLEFITPMGYCNSIPMYRLTNTKKSSPKKTAGVVFEFSVKEFPRVPTMRFAEQIAESSPVYADEVFAAIDEDFKSSTGDIQTATYEQRQWLEDRLRQQIFAWIIDHEDAELPPKSTFVADLYTCKTQNKTYPITITIKTKRNKKSSENATKTHTSRRYCG